MMKTIFITAMPVAEKKRSNTDLFIDSLIKDMNADTRDKILAGTHPTLASLLDTMWGLGASRVLILLIVERLRAS